jgi:phenylalanyl-tRNA synthetase beta chain
MNLSLNWLGDYVDVSGITQKDLVEGLTMSGSKAEKVRDLAEPLSKIVIGRVTEIKRHENSDKLWICTVDVGGSSVQIVTGAQNVTQGAIVPVVLDGGVVLNRADGSVTKIKKGKLRGEVSEGMLCSPDELGLEQSDTDGIMILGDDAAVGSCAREYLGLRDTVIEFEITNNRPDCLSVTGLAREVAATFDLPLNIPSPEYKSVSFPPTVSVTVENPQLCTRYMAGFARNVKIAPSPKWMQSRLKAQGVRPINNIVDITNYVMLEYGHPLHAFDLRFIEGGEIIVRNAVNGEEITLLDGNTVALDSDTLVIADKSKPLAVAGVMGGEYSGIVNGIEAERESTGSVVFEAACFDKASVRMAAKKIGRRTDSSARFEKGLNPVNVKSALMRALQLVAELEIGEVSDVLVDVANFTDSTKSVEHDAAWINTFLGTDISADEQIGIFKRLGLGLGLEYNDGLVPLVTVPPWRSDINLPCDLAEEIARIYGYNRIESTRAAHIKQDTGEYNTRKLVNVLTAQGCHECITYSFVHPSMAADYAVRIRNPFGEETSVMRTSLIPSVLKTVERNIRARNMEGRLFELGRVYNDRTAGGERDMLCIALYGKDECFYSMKGIFEELLENFKVSVSVGRYTEPPFHSGRAACCGFAKFGEVSPLVLQEYGISERVYAAEIDLARFFETCNAKIRYSRIPEYPAVQRDLSLVCTNDVASGAITEIIGKSSYLENTEFFDVFDLGNGQKSISYKLTFRKIDGTLTSEEVDRVISKLLAKLEKENIKLRG